VVGMMKKRWRRWWIWWIWWRRKKIVKVEVGSDSGGGGVV